MLWGPGPRLNTPWLTVASVRQGTGSLPQLVWLVGTAEVLPIETPMSNTSKLSPLKNASVTVNVSPSLGATKFPGRCPHEMRVAAAARDTSQSTGVCWGTPLCESAGGGKAK